MFTSRCNLRMWYFMPQLSVTFFFFRLTSHRNICSPYQILGLKSRDIMADAAAFPASFQFVVKISSAEAMSIKSDSYFWLYTICGKYLHIFFHSPFTVQLLYLCEAGHPENVLFFKKWVFVTSTSNKFQVTVISQSHSHKRSRLALEKQLHTEICDPVTIWTELKIQLYLSFNFSAVAFPFC